MKKLIRNKILSRVDISKISNATEEEKLFYAVRKLNEEVRELEESEFKDIFEYADVLEVLELLGKLNGISFNDMLAAKESKKQKKGDFFGFILLDI